MPPAVRGRHDRVAGVRPKWPKRLLRFHSGFKCETLRPKVNSVICVVRGQHHSGKWPPNVALFSPLVRPGPHADGRRHTVVIGMHRSGTSATAHTLAELGLSTPDSDDLIEAGPYNERGYWESRTISRFDESVLRRLGGTWSAPPRISAGWEMSPDATMKELRAQAAELAASTFGRPPVVMKDPRLCLTLPLWRAVLSSEPIAVLIFRDPLEVALSLQGRDGFPLTLGLALWHRYVRQSMASLIGLPVLVAEYAKALDEPQRWVSDLVAFLGANGITVGESRSDQAARVLAQGVAAPPRFHLVRHLGIGTAAASRNPSRLPGRTRSMVSTRPTGRALVGGGCHRADLGRASSDRSDAIGATRAQVGQEVTALSSNQHTVADHWYRPGAQSRE